MNNTKIKNRDLLLPAACFCLCVLAVLFANFAYANVLQDAVGAVQTILRYICIIVGALLAVVGVVKFAMAHANEDGPATQKAIMMIATGILLVILGTIVIGKAFDITDWFTGTNLLT